MGISILVGTPLQLIRWLGLNFPIHNPTYYNTVVFSPLKVVSWIIDYWLKKPSARLSSEV